MCTPFRRLQEETDTEGSLSRRYPQEYGAGLIHGSCHIMNALFGMACSLSVEGAEAIADIVKRANLKELNLYMNDIGDAGILKVLLLPQLTLYETSKCRQPC